MGSEPDPDLQRAYAEAWQPYARALAAPTPGERLNLDGLRRQFEDKLGITEVRDESFEAGYRKAIADLRDDEAFDLWFSRNLGRHPYPGEEKRRVTADFLESRLTKEQP